MKFLISICIIHLSIIFFQENIKLNGRYMMQYEEKYSSQNCIVIFKDSIYIRKLSDGKSIKGRIFYNKFNISLKDDEDSLQMDFLKREIKRDTIYFGTKNLNEKQKESELTINTGKLIRIR